jgi:hypothetical protein
MTTIRHEFVRSVPEKLETGVVYVSIEFATAAHLCACGCGREVVTPISPTDWELRYDGESVSLFPSIGNWSFDCRSHYWITKGRIRWAEDWTDDEVAAVRKRDQLEKVRFYQKRHEPEELAPHSPEAPSQPVGKILGSEERPRPKRG